MGFDKCGLIFGIEGFNQRVPSASHPVNVSGRCADSDGGQMYAARTKGRGHFKTAGSERSDVRDEEILFEPGPEHRDVLGGVKGFIVEHVRAEQALDAPTDVHDVDNKPDNRVLIMHLPNSC